MMNRITRGGRMPGLAAGMFRLIVIAGGGLALGAARGDEPAAPAPMSAAATPLVMFALTPLPLGRVEPRGWLRDWAVTMRNGITGYLDERNEVFENGWKGVAIHWSFSNADGTFWPLEQSAYWLDGAIRLGYILKDEALIRKIRDRLDPVVDGVHQAAGGTSFVHWKENWTPRGFDCWAQSHMGRALVALYQGSGERKVLDALVKVYSNYSTDLGPLDFADVRGLCNLDPMMETYAYTGDGRILERATTAFARTDVQALVRTWSEGTVAPGHMVITYENIRVPAVMYPWTGQETHLAATRRAFDWLDEHHMLPYGLPSSEEYAAGIGAARKTETCNIPAMLMAAHWMYRIEGDGAWGDRMEKAFFNAAPAALTRDGERVVYYQTPNRIKPGVLPVESPHPGAGGIAYGPLACAHVLCCVGASNRIIPSYIANMWMATADRGLAATLYGPCAVRADVGDGVPVRIACDTAYPFEETLRMTVEPERPVRFPLYLRRPGWCAEPVVTVNNRRVRTAEVPDRPGFLRIDRRWRRGDIVTMTLPMRVRVDRGLEGPYPAEARGYFHQIPQALFEPRALPFASVSYGPLLFALPIPEQDENTPVDGAKWQYALNLHPDEAAGIKVERTPMPARWNWPLDAPLALTVPARAFDWQPTLVQALPAAPVAGGEPERIRLIPYGCAKFQISMFPVTEHAWEGRPTPE
jgi:uncharacterized protein